MESVPSPEDRGEWTYWQSSGGQRRAGSGSEHGVECSTEKPRAPGPERPDGPHPVSQVAPTRRRSKHRTVSTVQLFCVTSSSVLPATSGNDYEDRISERNAAEGDFLVPLSLGSQGPVGHGVIVPASSLQERHIYLFPKELVEEVAKLYLPALTVKLTVLTQSQVAYTGVNVEGPFKSEHHRSQAFICIAHLQRARAIVPHSSYRNDTCADMGSVLMKHLRAGTT